MEISAYLNFGGNCAEAFRFYEKLLGGTITMMQTHGESPMRNQTSADWHDRVLHARLAVGSNVLMGSDVPPQWQEKPQGFAVSVSFPTAGDAKRVFNTLAESGRVTMAFQSTFWSPGFGAVVDRFGTPWMVNTDAAGV